MIDLDSDDRGLLITFYVFAVIDLAGFIGMAVVDFQYYNTVGSVYDTVTGGLTMFYTIRSAWLSATCVFIIFFSSVEMIFHMDWDLLVNWVAFFGIGVTYLVYCILVMTTQTDSKCATFVQSAYNSGIGLFRATYDLVALERTMNLQNASNYPMMLQNYTTTYCGVDYNTRAVFLGLQSPFLALFIVLPLAAICGLGGNN